MRGQISIAVVILLAITCSAQLKPKHWAAVNLALASLDYESAHAMQHGPRYPGATYCYETNTLFASRTPTRKQFYLLGLGYDAGVEAGGWVLFHYLQNKHHHVDKFWIPPFTWVTYYHVRGTVTNFECP